MKCMWLDTSPGIKTGVTFGIPWSKGKTSENDSFTLNGKTLQSWPTAYWPDGSVKWTAHSGVFDKQENEEFFELERISSNSIEKGIKIKETEEGLTIENSSYVFQFAKSGSTLLFSVKKESGEMVGQDGRLIAILQEKEEKDQTTIIKETVVESKIESAVVERKGQIQTTIKMTGFLGDADKLPFTIRFIIYKGTADLKIISTNFFNGEAETDFIKGFGLSFSASLSGEPYNRQVRLVTEEGVYNEQGYILSSRRYRQSDVYKKQAAGKLVTPDEETEDIFAQASTHALWNDFSFAQETASEGIYCKRTSKNQAWLTIPTIDYTDGLLYAGGDQGGVSIGMKDFTEKYPSELEVTGLNEETTSYTIWFWSPKSTPMDMRHYDAGTHVDSAYEGFPEYRATPVGIANTSEVSLRFFESVPTNGELKETAALIKKPPLLVTDSSYYATTEATGAWPEVDRSSEKKTFLEDQLQSLIDFYQQEIQQRKWKGYWNYGDVMHTYDSSRKQWFYDIGGYAWQNTELVPNLWFWYSFFRTGNASVFRMVEAMSRHNSEVDRYHFGKYAGLGSRHNVSHWGCGCKEARISMACLYKYYYYLTGDARMGELLDETKDADQTLDYLDPMREFFEKPEEKGVTHARIGPDWAAFSSNWMSRWEREKDTDYLRKIETGLKNIKKTPHRLLSGPVYEYDTKTNEMNYMGTGTTGGYHMIIAFGAPQVWLELADLLNDEEFKDMIAEFGEVYAMSEDEKQDFSNNKLDDNHFHWPMFSSGLVAYAAFRNKNKKLAKIAKNYLLDEEISGVSLPIEVEETTGWKKLNELPWISTNVAAQWSLNALLCLKYIPEQLAK